MTAPGPGSLASLDGEIMPTAEAVIPVTDEGLVRGDGAFEVIRVYDGGPFALEAHLARLERSARNLRLPVDLEAVRAEAHRLLAQAGSGPDHQALRIMCTRGGRRIMYTEPMPELPDVARVKTITYSPTFVLEGIKSLSYGANMLATRLAVEAGFDEALLVTPAGTVLEAPTSTIFWVSDGELLTPPLSDHILASITRAVIMEVSDAREQSCHIEELMRADEVFLASSIREVQPVSVIDDHRFPNPLPGPVSLRTEELARERIAAELIGAGGARS